MSTTKRFVIGIGSQRAGSTLLSTLIEECTSIYMHPVKELHYFDSLYNVRDPAAVQDFSRRQLQREIDRICSSDDLKFMNRRYKNYLRANLLLLSKPIAQIDYADLFRPCYGRYAVLGEVTPEYMALPEEGVAHMAKTVGRDARIILIARNPVKRLVSAFKLLNVYNAIELSPAAADEKLRHLLATDSSWIKAQDRYSAYDTALQTYGRHFDHVLFLRYDDFVEDADHLHKQLSNFLDVPIELARVRATLGVRRNDLGANYDIAPETLAMIEARYRADAEFLTARFGKPCLL